MFTADSFRLVALVYLNLMDEDTLRRFTLAQRSVAYVSIDGFMSKKILTSRTFMNGKGKGGGGGVTHASGPETRQTKKKRGRNPSTIGWDAFYDRDSPILFIKVPQLWELKTSIKN